jgi:predicted transcriptional regulator
MKSRDQDLKYRLCDAYFSILVSSKKNSIIFEDLCLQCNVSYDEAKKIIPEDSIHNKFFF